ncbi:hypothetical protein BER11_22715 [Escherichia coli]|nr:hypothetical protein [Escherichia coli]PDV15362.1 hypothetical protein BER11_22715 [Escherichia coli]QDG03272.1 hypothetical protein EWM66_00145 [Escherichia coli O157:H7]QJZ96924.1 hypothetical protein E3166_27790 [Escherichia coli O157:H7]QKA45429.1 hypothetical protein E4U63_27415 [Escherichia coli O157:H7]
MDPLLIIHGSVYWIEPPDMWINHSRETAYTTAYKGACSMNFRVFGLKSSLRYCRAFSRQFMP